MEALEVLVGVIEEQSVSESEILWYSDCVSGSKIMDEASDRAFNELMQEVQHQFLCYKEESGKRFQNLEELVDLAAQKMSILRNTKAKKQERRLVNPLGWKANVRYDRTVQQPDATPDSLLEEGAGVFDWLQDCDHQFASFGIGNTTQEWKNLTEEEDVHASWKTYIGEPIYDELGEQECWPETEFILEALKGGKPNSPKPLQCEIKPSERSEELGEFPNVRGKGNGSIDYRTMPSQLEDQINRRPYWSEFEDQQLVWKQVCLSILMKEEPSNSLVNKPNKVLEYGDNPKSVDFKDGEKQRAVEEVTSIILGSVRELIDDVPCRYSLTTKSSYGPGKKYSKFGEQDVLIFDSGGNVQKSQTTGVIKLFNEMIINKKMKMDAVAIITSPCGQLEHLQLQEETNMEFCAIMLLWKEYPQLRSIVFLPLMAKQDRTQCQEIQEVCGETTRVLNKINQQDDPVRVERNVITYKCHYMVLRQGRPEVNNSMKAEYHEVSRKNVTIFIFDPGGDSSHLHGVLLAIFTETPNFQFQQMLQVILKGNDMCSKEKESTLKEKKKSKRAEHCPGPLDQGTEKSNKSANLIHEDKDAFKGEGLLGSVS